MEKNRRERRAPSAAELRERAQELKLDSLIVFGQGPVKPVLLESELTTAQAEQWRVFVKDPLHSAEPDFRVVPPANAKELEQLDQSGLKGGELDEARAKIRQEWQHNGRLALNRWCRQNALAAGEALMLGLTDRIILSGGKTQPGWAKEVISPDRLAEWPSEAEMMKDIIVRMFGKRYQKLNKQSIESALVVEDASTNTLQNFALTMNTHPGLTQGEQVGVLGSDFHVRRIKVLADLYGVPVVRGGELSAQDMLEQKAANRRKGRYEKILQWMGDAFRNADLRNRLKGEERWESGLVDEKYLAYWIGYAGYLEDPKLIMNILEVLKDPSWRAGAEREFARVGLDFNQFADTDLAELRDTKPDDYRDFKTRLLKLSHYTVRVLPPER